MINTLDKLVEFVIENDAPFWKIFPYGPSKDKFFFQSGTEENISMDVSIERLRKRVGLLEPGRYTIQCKFKTSDTKSIPETTFSIGGENSQQNLSAGMAQVNGASNVGYSEEKVEKMIADALEKDRNKRVVEDLTKERDELKKENKELQGNGAPAVIGRVFNTLEPHIGLVLQHLLPAMKPATIAAVGYNGTTETVKENAPVTSYEKPAAEPLTQEEAQARLGKVLNAWNEIDPNRMLAIIETVVATAYNDVNTYNLYANMLLK